MDSVYTIDEIKKIVIPIAQAHDVGGYTFSAPMRKARLPLAVTSTCGWIREI